MAKQKKQKSAEVHVLTEQEARELNKDIVKLEKNLENPYYEKIEEERQNIFKTYRNSTRRNNIIMIIVVAMFIGAFILITRTELWATITGWVVVGSVLVGLVIYYLLTRNKYPNTSKAYFRDFWFLSNSYLFDQNGFENCEIDLNEKYQLADVAADRVYKDIVDIASRNIVRGEYEGEKFSFGELAFYKAGQKRGAREVLFVGRHLAIPNELHFEGRYIINLRGEKGLDVPNDVDDLTKLVEEGSFFVYGEEGRNVEKELGKSLLEGLKKIEVKDPLLNISLVLWAGRSSAYLSYDDSIVAIPFETELNKVAYESLKINIEKIFKLLKDIK